MRNPEAITASGFHKTNAYNFNTQLYANVQLTKDLSWMTKVAGTFDYNFSKLREHAVDNYYFRDGSYAHNNGVWHLGVADSTKTNFLTTLFSTLNYTKTNGKHYFNLLGGYNNQELSQYRMLGGTKTSFPLDGVSELNAGAPLGQVAYGTANEWAIRPFFGRFSYDYQGKYLFEANARYDGAPRIAPDTRWGIFPSVSGAWRISEESFFKNQNLISNLKLRASYGKLGNQNIGSVNSGFYPYQELLSVTSYPFSTLSPVSN